MESDLREGIEKVLLCIFLMLRLFPFLFGSIVCFFQHFQRSLFLQIWDAVGAEPETHSSAALSDYFNVCKISSPYILLTPLTYIFHTILFCLIGILLHFLIITDMKVDITALSSYEFEEDDFTNQVALSLKITVNHL